MTSKIFNSFLKYFWLPWILFLALIVSTILYAYFEKMHVESRRLALFSGNVLQAQQAIIDRLKDNVQILKGSKGLFISSDDVSRKEWKNYFETLQLDSYFMGIQGIGYSKIILPENLADHVAGVRNEGFPDYNIRPSGKRDIYTSIIYLEPFSNRNVRAFGFDMYTDPVRRDAMKKAWETGEPAMSGKVKLVQETDKDVQPGFLIYFPVYKNGAYLKTKEERLSKLDGFVYSPFRVKDLIHTLFKNRFSDIQVKIYDGDEAADKNLLYDNSENFVPDFNSANADYKKTISLHFAQHNWLLVFCSGPDFGSSSERNQPFIILFVGFIISLLVFLASMFLSKAIKAKDEIIKEAEKTIFMAESMPEKVCTGDFAGNITYYNKLWVEYTGMTKDQLIVNGLQEVLFPQDFEEDYKAWMYCLETGSDFQREHRVKRYDGVYRWHLCRGSAQLDKQGKPIMWVLTTVDIHDQRIKTEELKKIHTDLDNFVYTASHDLKAPIANVEGIISALQDVVNKKQFEDFNTLISMANASIGKFKITIQDLTDISRVQKNFDETKTEVEVNQILAEVISSISNDIQKYGANIIADFSLCPVIYYSRRNLRSIIYNLVTNAIKFKHPSRKSEIQISTKSSDEYYILTVTDNGLGIPQEKHSKIFQMFKRLHDHVEGTGVGLYIVKRIIENNEGKIELESELGVGTSFHVYIRKG